MMFATLSEHLGFVTILEKFGKYFAIKVTITKFAL